MQHDDEGHGQSDPCEHQDHRAAAISMGGTLTLAVTDANGWLFYYVAATRILRQDGHEGAPSGTPPTTRRSTLQSAFLSLGTKRRERSSRAGGQRERSHESG
jgi:hypothetical protein